MDFGVALRVCFLAMTSPLSFLSASLAIADYDFDISHTTGGDIKGLVTSVLRKEGEKWLIVAARPMVPAQQPGTQH
jgi:hypothetical protein